jgi:hypothetical protein
MWNFFWHFDVDEHHLSTHQADVTFENTCFEGDGGSTNVFTPHTNLKHIVIHGRSMVFEEGFFDIHVRGEFGQ